MYGPSEGQNFSTQPTQPRIIDMPILYTYIILVAAAIIVTLLKLRNAKRSHLASDSRACRLKISYIKQVVNLLQDDSRVPMRIVAKSTAERIALCEAIYIVRSHTYGTDSSLLDQTIEDNHLERLLLRRINISMGYKRARWIMLMSCLPLSQQSVCLLERLLYSGNQAVRIAALTTLLAATPQMAIRRIISLRYRLSPLDISRIISLLRRGIIPIAYEPLLQSDDHNLQMLGIAIVRNFGIEIADRHLHDIIASSSDSLIVREAIWALSSLGRPLGRAKIRQRMEQMNDYERKSFCRHLANEGYSVQALRTLFSEREMRYAETLIKSYKRDLVCQQYT